jgi:16S rRNA processing protein RimM
MALEPKSSRLPFRRLKGRGIAEDELELGFVSGVFGVQGEVRLHLHNRDSEVFGEPLECVLVDTNGDRYECECIARAGAGKRVIGRFAGLVDREVAADLRDFKLVVGKDFLPALAEDEFYFHAVIGMSVWAGGTRRGELVGVHSTGAHEVFEIQTQKGSVFVPAIRETVISLDMAQERLELITGPFEEE